MNLKQVILSDASLQAKVSALAILLDKELPLLTEKVNEVKKLQGEQGERGLKGDVGEQGVAGKDGKDGRDGKDGKDGKDGQDGQDGVSVVDARLEFDGSLSFIFSDGKEINVGDILPQNTVEKFQVIARSGGVSQSVTDALVDLQNQIDALGGGGGGITSVTSTDGSVDVTTTSGIVDLSVAVAASTTNVVCLVRNNTGATLTKGTVVYINGTIGQNPTVTKAIATSDTTSAQTLGVMSANLANNSNGYVTIIGLVTNIDTSAYTDGEQLYLSGTVAGGYTATKPHAPTHLVYVAVVEHAHPTQGKLFVKVQNGYEMDELHNVSAQSPSNGDILIYNTSTSLWEKNTPTNARTALSLAKSGANTDLTSVALTTGTITTAPSSSSDIVNKSYADSIAAGVNFHAAVQYATTAALPANTYNNGTSGVGATLTAVAVGTLTIDGYTFVIGDVGKRILIKNEVTQANNGVYTLTQAGTALLPYILTRATDYDSSGSGTNEVDEGDYILVINGTVNANTSWVQQTPLPITIGSTSIVFIEFAASQTYTAGTGLTLTTNQFSITNTGTAGTYGSASTVPVITTNTKGQITSVTPTNIAISGSAVSGNIAGSANSVANALTAGTGITFSSGTTYDGSSAITINATGGGYTPSIDRLTTTQQSTSTALANVTQLVKALVANATYRIDCFVTFQSAATTTGLNLGFTSPTGCVCSVEVVVPITSTAAATQLRTTFPNAAATNTGNVLGTGVTAINSNHTARISGIITNGANAGNFQVQFATEVNASAITLQTSSVMILERIA